jgi:DNA invertase Pin-like site-specific DNA recombinase
MRTVAYYRVSTDRQGRSGLGLEAQREAVRVFLAGKGWPPVAEFVEIESGKRKDRPELAKAMEACRLYRATLVIAKLDRLARNVAFVSALMESGVEFVAADFPQANRLTIHILAAVAEHEAAMVSQRTKAALAAAKARGTKLGGFRGHAPSDAVRAAASQAKAAGARENAERVLPTIRELQAGGVTSLSGLARELNSRGVPTARGTGQWQAMQVQRVLRLAGEGL